MTMAMPHIVCNYCEDVILDVHNWTVYRGTIYHWACLLEMREKPREPIPPKSIGGRDGIRRWDGRPLDYKSPMERAFNWLFRRKT